MASTSTGWFAGNAMPTAPLLVEHLYQQLTEADEALDDSIPSEIEE